MEKSRAFSRAATGLGVVAVWVLIATRIIPDKAYDRGIYVSVAERLRAGDRLYADVWDNKDPLYYWALALARTFGPYADILFEAAWLIIACVAVSFIALQLEVGRPLSFAVGSVAAPLLLTSGLYSPGATHLPGVAITLAALGCALWGRPAASGMLLACLALLKLVLLPLAIALVLLVMVHRRNWRDMASAGAGVLVGIAAFGALLGIRGELGPYLVAQQLNVNYSGTQMLIDPADPIGTHLRRGLGVMGGGVVIMLSVAALASWALARHGREESRDSLQLLGELMAVAVLGGTAILAVTGMWPHHAQVLYVAGALCLVLIARHLQDPALPTQAGATVLAVAALVLAGGWLPDTFVGQPSTPGGRLSALTATSPETTALLAEGSTGSYARLGQHDDLGHAEGLGSWTLACPRFHQYPWDSAAVLTEALACASEQPYLLVSAGIEPVVATRGSETWNKYVADIEALLTNSYTCRPFEGGRVCRQV